ncbi:TetR/AcrR family transcriptional regulator, partial [Alcaligenes pakistanensis]
MPTLPQARRIPRQSRSRALVEAILEATARVLSERGYAGTNTNVVAEVAGVSVGSVYQYFPNKDSLIAALHERHALQMNQAMESSLADT